MSAAAMTVPVDASATFASGFSVEALDAVLAMVRPALQEDGGDFVVHGVDDDGVLHLELMGACGTCPLSIFTLVAGIEQLVVTKVPGIVGVMATSPNLPKPLDR